MPSRASARATRPVRRLAVTAVTAAAVLGACVPADGRPTFADTTIGVPIGSPTGHAELDELLTRVDGADRVRFHAVYTVERKLGPVSATVHVDQDPPRTAVELDDTRFLLGDDPRTCSLTTGECESGTLEQRIAHLGVTSRFWAASPAQTLRVAYARRVSEPFFSTQTIAGLACDCVDIDVAGGTETYCITPAGPVAHVETGAYVIDLTEFSHAPDEAQLTAPD